jgi:hypothetical protein
MPKYKLRDYDVVAPSKKQFKKYDVFDKSGRYITSFGDNRYDQYYDKFGYYKKWNHGNLKRRDNYRKRHANDYIDDPNHAGFWSYNFLW